MEFTIPRLGWRSVPLLVAGLIAGAFVLSPAVGEAATFLTKKKADRRYLGNASVVSLTQTVPNNDGASITVPCPAGRQATGGGMETPLTPTSTLSFFFDETKPVLSGVRTSGWNVEVGNPTSSPVQVTAYAVCAP